ncbi:MAG: hypothetical protein H6718_05090 [Polyangiaceae bacterium]|nr:hypothetical protein [Myxococcales bacterium]MCB9584747.1 hypothetical protein [Polyangiaceae bacterium]MCB9607680.1 hypothetical protein [Polyangiaceae bacterium]
MQPERGKKSEALPQVAEHLTPEERMLNVLVGALWQVEVENRFGSSTTSLAPPRDDAAA